MDHKGKFLDVLVGFSGRNNDTTQLRATQIFNKLEPGFGQSNPVREFMLSNGIVVDGVPSPLLILGDCGYELSTFILPRFKDPELRGSQEKGRFNTKHAQTRVVVEHAFGVLKNRFRCLLRPLELSETNVHVVVTACMILHNMCVDARVAEPLRDERYHELFAEYHDFMSEVLSGAVPMAAPCFRTSAASVGAAENVRNAIVRHVNRVFPVVN